MDGINMDIEYYTTNELIKELVSRHTFIGIIINSTKEAKLTEEHPNWNVLFRNLSAEQVHFILKGITQQLETKS